ncbi:MAG: type II toxin-antitoxin system RelE/ParE family toxin [Bacteroidia bacterium]
MEKEKTRIVTISPSAIDDIDGISGYIIEEGFPETADKFINRMLEFIFSLYIYPFIHSECCFKKFKRRNNWRCAVFENNYIIAYKIFKFKIVVHAVIHAARLK